jgi:hypothetical protein
MSEERKIALSKAYTNLNHRQSETMDLRKTIQRVETTFAQAEVLDFIRSDRYSSTPLNFANALAGLPHIHWRQSMTRRTRFEHGARHGLTYTQFLIVAKTLKHHSVSTEEATERMKTRLLKAKGNDVGLLNTLAENWYFLRSAIEAVVPGSHSPPQKLPYRIFEEYQRRIASRDALEIVRADKENMTTPAYVKWRAQQVGAGH